MFSVGLEGLRHLPGDVIEVLDNNCSGIESGGRIIAVDGNTVTLDRDVKIDNNAYLSYQDVNAQMVKVKVKSQKSPNQLITTEPLNANKWSVWLLTHVNVSSRLYKAMAIKENSDGTYEITAVQHEPRIGEYVDFGAVFTQE